MVSFNAVGLNLSGITNAIDAYSQRAREEEEKRRTAAEVGAFGDRLLGTIATSGGSGGGAPSRAAEVLGVGSQYQSRLPSFAGGTSKMGAVDPDLVPSVVEEATKRGLNPKDVLTAMSYETGGTFNPWQAGPKTKWGQHRGLIQWGEPQAAQYGVTAQTPVRDQVAASMKYLEDRGVKPGHGLMEIYSAINAGGVGNKFYGLSDAKAGGAPGTVADKVNQQMGGHAARAEALLAGHKAPTPVTREAGTQQVQTASRADADAPAPGAVEAGQFNLPGGRGTVAGGSEVGPERLEMLRQGLRSTNPTVRQMALQEIQSIRAAQAKEPSYDFQKVGDDLYRTNPRSGTAEKIVSGPAKEGRTPEAVQEFVWARTNGMTQARTPVEYAAEKARILAEEKPKGPQKLTEAQERNRGLFVTAIGEMPIVEQTYDQMGSWQGRAGEAVAGLTGYRGFTPEAYQRGANAIERIAQAALYSTSGATAPVEEVKKTAESVTPMPGDAPQTIADKRERLARMIEGIKQKAAILSGEAPAAAAPATPATPAPQGDGWVDAGDGFKIRKKQ